MLKLEIYGNLNDERIKDINNLKTSFQNGVDRLYNKLKDLGFTPDSKSLDSIIEAIDKMYTDRYNDILTNTKIQAICKVYRWSGGGSQIVITITGDTYIDNGELKLKNISQYPLANDINTSGAHDHNMIAGQCMMKVI